MDTTHPSLLSRVRDPQDHESWREFDARYRDLVLRYCARMGLQLADAEDVRQSVMISMSNSLANFRYDPSLGRFRDYLGRSVRNAVYSLARKRHRSSESPLAEASETAAPPELDDVWDREWVDHHYRLAMGKVRRAVDARSLAVFEALLAGESVEAVAAEKKLTKDAIYKIKQRIKERLQAEVLAQVKENEFPERLELEGAP